MYQKVEIGYCNIQGVQVVEFPFNKVDDDDEDDDGESPSMDYFFLPSSKLLMFVWSYSYFFKGGSFRI